MKSLKDREKVKLHYPQYSDEDYEVFKDVNMKLHISYGGSPFSKLSTFSFIEKLNKMFNPTVKEKFTVQN